MGRAAVLSLLVLLAIIFGAKPQEPEGWHILVYQMPHVALFENDEATPSRVPLIFGCRFILRFGHPPQIQVDGDEARGGRTKAECERIYEALLDAAPAPSKATPSS